MVKVMDENYRLDIDDLENVTGGTGESYPVPKYNVGDRVLLNVYPDYGVGTVMNVYFKDSIWTCQVRFDAGIMDAPQDEFDPV